MKIKNRCSWNKGKVSHDMIIAIYRLLNLLTISNVKNFMLYVDNHSQRKDINYKSIIMKEWLSDLKFMQKNYTVNIEEERRHHRFCITNKGCTINGYDISYKMV